TLTELAVPLRSSEGIIGALDVQSTKRNAFNKNDIEILQTLADQIAVAVENARLFEDAQDKAERARAMATASQITSRMSTDFEGSIHFLFETISAAGQYTQWWLGLVDADGNTLRCIAHHAETPESGVIQKVMYLDQDQNSLIDAYKSRQVIIENDLKISSHFDMMSSGIFTLFGKHIAAPVLTAGTDEVSGVLLVGRSWDAANLDHRDLELLATLTGQISVALETRRLFEQVQEEQQTLQAVLNTMPVSVIVVDHNSTIILANEQAQTMLGENIRPGNSVDSINHVYQSGSEDLYPAELIPLNQALSTRQVVSAEDLAIQQPDGSRMDILARAAPILDARGEIYAVVSVYQDITELRELERALQESLSETTKLYEASRAISHANSIETLADAVINQMLTLAPDQLYMTLINHTDSDNVEVSVLLSWPDRSIKHIEAVDLPHSILVPNSGLGTTNLTFATRNLHLLPGIEETELQKLRQKKIAALAVLPLEIRGQVFGSIIGVFNNERHFTPEERRFLLTLADQAAVSLDAVQSFERTQHTLQSISR
ncbi:MAG TPA: GAF domain-containing protein, partial [Aggregatilineales bacterium]|nr:GAF domain-containing protein [Aggregatilineales bacterium]